MHYLLLDEAHGEVRGAVLAKEGELQRHTCSDEPGEVHRDRELGGARRPGKSREEQLEMLLSLGLGQNWPQCGVVGNRDLESRSVGWCRVRAGA